MVVCVPPRCLLALYIFKGISRTPDHSRCYAHVHIVAAEQGIAYDPGGRPGSAWLGSVGLVDGLPPPLSTCGGLAIVISRSWKVVCVCVGIQFQCSRGRSRILGPRALGTLDLWPYFEGIGARPAGPGISTSHRPRCHSTSGIAWGVLGMLWLGHAAAVR